MIARRFLLTGLVASLVFVPPAQAQKRYPGQSWDKAATPARLGWAPEKLKAARDYSNSLLSGENLIPWE